MTRLWKEISGLEGRYAVSSHGRIKNLKTGYILKIQIREKGRFSGYSYIGLYVNRKPVSFCVHRLVGLAFIPNPENKPFINHKDGKKANNKVKNLEWVTRLENNLHAIKTGLQPQVGEGHKDARLTESKVREIRRFWEMKKFNSEEMSRMYGIAPQNIMKVIHRRTWKNVS